MPMKKKLVLASTIGIGDRVSMPPWKDKPQTVVRTTHHTHSANIYTDKGASWALHATTKVWLHKP